MYTGPWAIYFLLFMFDISLDKEHTMLYTWWRHQMETFSAFLAICAGYSPVPGEFPTQRPVTRSFDVYFDLRPNKRLSKQWWGWRFETQSCSLWRHCNDYEDLGTIGIKLFEVTIKVLHSCLLYFEIYSVIIRLCNTGRKQLIVSLKLLCRFHTWFLCMWFWINV